MMKILSDLYLKRRYRSKDKEPYDNINAQFLCVMNGGLLVQNCFNHALGRTHGITDGKTIYQITSTHHQMQYPFNLNDEDYNILYTSEERRSYDYEGDKIDSSKLEQHGEPEIVYYHKAGLPKCLAVQGHPEMIPESPVAKMINNLIKNTINEIK